MANGYPFPISLDQAITRSPPLTVTQQLQALLTSRELSTILPISDGDLRTFLHDILPALERRPAPSFATALLAEPAQADVLLRAQLAALDKSRVLNPERSPDALVCRGLKVEVKDVHRCVAFLQSGIRQCNSASSPKTLQIPLKTKDASGGRPVSAPGRRTSTQGTSRVINLAPQTVELNQSAIPSKLTAEHMIKAPPEFVQAVYDLMISKLTKTSKYVHSDFPIHPTDRAMPLTCTQDVEHLPMPMVRAELVNPWIRTDFHRQVLSILTFYKMWQVHKQVIDDMQEWGWPRDLNARGFTVFYPEAKGTELLFLECGVRVHSSDRECSQATLRAMRPQDVAELFGETESSGGALQSSLSQREQRQLKDILLFPFTLMAAFLSACRESIEPRSLSPVGRSGVFRGHRAVRPVVGAPIEIADNQKRTRSTPVRKEQRLAATVPTHPASPGAPPQSRFSSKMHRVKEILRSIASPPKEETSCEPSIPIQSPDHPLHGTALGALYLAMCNESCVNLRFFALMEEVRHILGIQTIGQAVLAAHDEALSRNPTLESGTLQQALVATCKVLQNRPSATAWDEKDFNCRPIDNTDVLVHLRHLGYE